VRKTYEIRRYRNSSAPDFIKALKLYSENIEPEYRTDTNEIIFWADNFGRRFEDSFFIVGFYLNGILIGFSELAYFKEERFVEVDYLVIDRRYRKNNTFHEFVDMIAGLLSEENIVYDYVICEVGCYFENREPTESSKTLIRLLKMSHFGIIKCAYQVPRLGKKNYESEMRAILMIHAKGDITQIKKETYLMILNALYYKYYQRWYNEFFNDAENKEYKILLDSFFEKIKKIVESKEFIEINGYQNILPLNPTDFSEVKAKKGVKALAFILVFVIAGLVLGSAAIFIRNKFELSIENQTGILSLSVLAASLAVSFFLGNKSNLPGRIIEKLLDKL